MPVTSIMNATVLSVTVPGKSWRYFEVSVPVGGGDARLLTEMKKPGGSLSALEPVLQVMTVDNVLVGNVSYDNDGLPGISGIDPTSFLLTEACTCTNCPCYIPYQAEALQYEAMRIQSANGSTTLWIAVFNNAPWTANISTIPPIQLRQVKKSHGNF